MTAIPVALARKVGADPDSLLPAFAWPGGYPLIYVDNEGSELCAVCANETLASDSMDPPVVSGDIYWEGPAIQCAGCGVMIDSAYGNPWCAGCCAALPDDPVEIGGERYCDDCAVLCEGCERPVLIEDGFFTDVDQDTGHQGVVCARCYHGV